MVLVLVLVLMVVWMVDWRTTVWISRSLIVLRTTLSYIYIYMIWWLWWIGDQSYDSTRRHQGIQYSTKKVRKEKGESFNAWLLLPNEKHKQEKEQQQKNNSFKGIYCTTYIACTDIYILYGYCSTARVERRRTNVLCLLIELLYDTQHRLVYSSIMDNIGSYSEIEIIYDIWEMTKKK